MQRQTKATCFGLATVLCWSTVASAFKLSLRHLDPVQLVLWSSLASTVTLALILALQGRLGLLRGFTRRDWAMSAGLGLVNPFVYYLVLFKAYDLLPAQEAQPLNYTWAVTLALLSIPLLRQPLRALDLAALAVSWCGVLAIATRGDVLGFRFTDPLGVGLALLSTVIWALYWIANTRDGRDPVAALFANFAFGTLFAALASPWLTDPLAVDLPGLLGAAYVGVFEMGLTFALWLTALRLSSSAARMGNLIFLSPPLSLVLIHVVVGEDIHTSTIWGLAFILAGLALQRLKRTKA